MDASFPVWKIVLNFITIFQEGVLKKFATYFASTTILALSMTIIFSGFSYKADVKFGYVNSDRIFAEYSKFQEAAKALEQERTQLQQDLQAKQDAFEKKRKEFESQQLLMSEKRKEEFNKELEELYVNIQNYTQENFTQGGKLDQRWAEVTKPIIEEVQQIIDKYGADEGFDMIFDTQRGTILYSKKEYDLTDKVLEILASKK